MFHFVSLRSPFVSLLDQLKTLFEGLTGFRFCVWRLPIHIQSTMLLDPAFVSCMGRLQQLFVAAARPTPPPPPHHQVLVRVVCIPNHFCKIYGGIVGVPNMISKLFFTAAFSEILC